MDFPGWDFLAGSEEKLCPCLPLSSSLSASLFSVILFLFCVSYTFPLSCLCSSAIGLPMDAGSTLPEVPADKGLQASSPSMLSQLYVHLMAASSPHLLTIHPFSSLSPIMAPSFFPSLCLMIQPLLCFCPGRSVSHLQPVASLASLSFSKPKYNFLLVL